MCIPRNTKNSIERYKAPLEQLMKERAAIRYDSIIDDAMAQLDDARAQYEEGKEKYDAAKAEYDRAMPNILRRRPRPRLSSSRRVSR